MLNSFGGNAEIDILIKAVDETQGAFKGVSSGLGLIAAGAAAVVAAVTAVSAAIIQVTKVTLEWGVSLNETKLKLGSTSEQAAGLKLAADTAGISIDLVNQRMMILEKGLETAKGAIGNTGQELKDLGINFKNADGTMMDSVQLLQSIADWFASTTDATARNNAEMTLFGRAGSDLDIMLTNLAGGGMKKYIDQAKKFGLALTDEQIAKIQATTEQMNTLKDAIKGAEVTIGVNFIPVLQNLVKWFGNLLAAEMPAITQFGQFLAMLTGGKVPALPSIPTAPSQIIDPRYKYLGTQGSGANLPVYSNPLTGGVTTNPPMINGAIAVNVKNAKDFAGPMPGYRYSGQHESLTPPEWTPLETAILNFVNIMKGINWTQIGTDLTTFGGDLLTIAEDIAAASVIANQAKFDIEHGGMGDIATAIIKQIATTLVQAMIIAGAEVDITILEPLKNAAENAVNTIFGGLADAIRNALININSILVSLGLPPIVIPGISKAGGGAFSGWALVGDAPGGRPTPYTEMVYAPHGAYVVPHSQMSGASAPAMFSGGTIPSMDNSDILRELRALPRAIRDSIQQVITT